jgi:hypothetical protein
MHSAELATPTDPLVDPSGPVVVPLGRPDGRPVGVVIVDRGRVRYRPVVDLEHVAWCVVAAAGLAGAAAIAATSMRSRPAIRSVSMGPGGWVSVKGATAPPLRPHTKRPWWARLLQARRLVIE